jgi:anti-sigma factor RsiW
MINCDKLRSMFSMYLDGEISQQQKEELDSHFEICPNCQETIRQIRIIQQSLKQMPQIKTSEGFEDLLRQQIFNSEQKTSSVNLSFHNWKVPAMGSALVLATIGIFLVFNNSKEPIKPPLANPGQINSSASPQFVGSKNSNSQTDSKTQTYQSSTLIADSLQSDSLRINTEGIQQVGGQ